MSKKVSENRTMPVILEELNASVDKYNLATDAVERVQLQVEHKSLVEEYNKASLLNAYADFMADEHPLIALAKAYYYDTISVKDNVHEEAIDGVKKSTVTRSVNEGCKKLNVVKFIEWTEECNKSIAADKAWKTKMAAARNSIENEWKKFFAAKGDTHAMSIGKTKKALQEMFNALVLIPSKSGKNAVIADGNIAKWVLGFANSRNDSKVDGEIVITGSVLPKNTWNALCLDILHKAVTDKTYDIIYGEPEEDAEPETEEPKAEAKADAKAKK